MTTGRGDALLQLAHLVGQVRLVTHGRGHPAQQGRDLGACLGEPEDVVDEQQDVLVLDVAEVLRHRQTGESDAQTSARRLIHLAEHQGGVLEHLGLIHLVDEVVALTGTLPHTGEHRGATEVVGDTVDHLLDEHGLAHTGTTEQADLATLDVGSEQVEHLDAGLQHLGLRLQIIEVRSGAVDRPTLGDLQGRRVGVEHVTGDVPDVPLGDGADRNRDRCTGVAHLGTTTQTIGRLERDRTGDVLTDVELDLQGDGLGLAHDLGLDMQGVEDLGHLADGELDVDDWADDADDATDAGSFLLGL